MSQAAAQSDKDELELEGGGADFQDELCRMLEDTRIFADLDRDDIEILAQWMNVYRARKGVRIFREGEKNAGLCVLVKGKIAIFKEADGPQQSKLIATVRAGRCIGEMSVVDGQPLSATAVAAEESTVLLVSKDNFHKLIERYPVLGSKLLMKIASMISLRLRHTTGQLVDYLEVEIVKK